MTAVPGSQRARSEWAVGRCEMVVSLLHPGLPWALAASAGTLQKSSQWVPCGSCPFPGLSALLRFYSEYPAHKVGVWLPQSSSGPTPRPQIPVVLPKPLDPSVSSLVPGQPQQQRSRTDHAWAGGTGQQAPSSIRRTPRSEGSMKYSCSKWCNFVCIQPTSCIFHSIMK